MSREVTPWNPSRRATARVKDALPAPTICPHCGGEVKLVSNAAIYGREFGEWPWAFLCGGCRAYVGLHPFTGIPLGTLATAPMREARQRAKAAFNPLWQSGRMSRTDAYAWLAKEMGIPAAECHIGMFDVAQCELVQKLSAPGVIASEAPSIQWERRRAFGNGAGLLEWQEWKPCTEAEATRVNGLRSWEVRRVTYGVTEVPRD